MRPFAFPTRRNPASSTASSPGSPSTSGCWRRPTTVNHPLLERLRFLSISANNLDEFYMVRVAGLKGQQAAPASPRRARTGSTPAQQLAAINALTGELMRNQQACWRRLRDELRANGIAVIDAGRGDAEEKQWLDGFFLDQIFPVLTPLAMDPAHPFPFIPNLGFAIVARPAPAPRTSASCAP